MQIEEQILAFFQEKKCDDLTVDTDLMAAGYVNSLFALEIVMYLEKTFHIRLKGKDITKENFRTIAEMAALVRRVQSR